MPLPSGARLGAYEIVSPLGAGGMGEVYRAHDARLGRDVALKTLPASVTNDPERLARFRREAQLLAKLNHPHIGSIYGFDEFGEHRFLVLELVDGETLAARIQRGAVPVPEALAIAREIAEALEAAHEKGIIHRDLKPSNIALTEHDRVKVLDFGLARAIDPGAGPASDALNSPTITSPMTLTQLGVILGTAAYMSPEQARARVADKRSDIWAFGCVLYEMLTGERAFKGEDVSDTMAAVLKSEPDWSALPPALPPAVRALLEGCLQKHHRDRIADISTARFVLQLPPSATGSALPAVSRARARWAWALVPLLVAAAGIGGAAALWSRPHAPAPPTLRFAVALPDNGVLTVARRSIAISPDGRRIVYSAGGRLYVRDLRELESRELPGGNPGIQPVFSPDGESVAFWGNSSLYRVPVTGGVPVLICCSSGSAPFGLSWDGDTIVYAMQGIGIFRVPANGGTSSLVAPVKPAEGLGASPQLLPGGDTLLFTLGPVLSTSSTYWEGARAVVQSLKTGQRKTLVEGASAARYIAPGYLVYMLQGTMMAVAFDPNRLEVSGAPVPSIPGIRRTAAVAGGEPHLSISDSGTLIYVPGPVRAGDDDVFLYTRTGENVEALGLPRGRYAAPRVSRDGKWLAVETSDGKNAVVSVYDLVSRATALRRITFSGNNRLPIWTRDGRVAFQSDREGDLGIFRQPIDGGPAERLTRAESGVAHAPEAWSPTDDVLLFSAKKGMTSSLWWYSLKERQAHAVAGVSPSNLPTNAAFAPDGRWFVYQVGEEQSGEGTTYVEPFPPNGAKFEIGRGGRALWSRDGKEIFYIPGPSQFASVAVETTPGFSFKRPVPLVRRFGLAPPASPRPYDLTADNRFVAVDVASQGTDQRAPEIHLVLNWLNELAAKLSHK